MSETFDFGVNIERLLDIIVNSFYSDKDVFLRELLSNSSDAINKLAAKDNNDGSIPFQIKILYHNSQTHWFHKAFLL